MFTGRDAVFQIQVAFAAFDGVKAIRLIRDRMTNQSRGFGFVEFVDLNVRHPRGCGHSEAQELTSVITCAL